MLEMANTWDALANDRVVLLRRHPELAIDDQELRDSHEEAAPPAQPRQP
jgi:hypothetical protein